MITGPHFRKPLIGLLGGYDSTNDDDDDEDDDDDDNDDNDDGQTIGLTLIVLRSTSP